MLERQLYSISCKQPPGAMRVSHERCLIFPVLNVCLFPSVWRRKPSTRRPPLAATSSRSLWGTHTSWFGTSADRRAFEPAGTHTTAAPRYGSLNVFGTWQINMTFCWLLSKRLRLHISVLIQLIFLEVFGLVLPIFIVDNCSFMFKRKTRNRNGSKSSWFCAY